MLSPRHLLARTWLLALAVSLGVLLPGPARAKQPAPAEASPSSPSSWQLVAPTLHLQPEGARVFLDLPAGWLPRSEVATLHSLHLTPPSIPGMSVELGIPRLKLDIEARSFGFGFLVLPRAAVAVVRFDPLRLRVPSAR